MLTVVHNDEIGRLRAELAQADLRLQERQLTLDKVEAQRRYSERLFSAAFDESPEAISLSRLSDGLLVDINQEWLRLTGFSREKVIGRKAVDFGLWPDQASLDRALEPLLNSGHLRNFETILAMKDGAARLVRLNGSLIDVAGSRHILMYLKDITAERMAEETLRSGELALTQANEKLGEQLRLYELTQSLAKVGYWIASPDRLTLTWSTGLHAIVGTRPGPTMSTLDARKFIHQDDLDLFTYAREKMDGETIEFRLWNVDGSIRWVRSSMHRQMNAAGERVDFGLMQDITSERAVTHALQDKLDFIERITTQIPDMVFQYQTRADGSNWFPFVSDAVHKMFRISPEEAQIGRAHV